MDFGVENKRGFVMRDSSMLADSGMGERFEKLALAHSSFMLNLARKLTRDETGAEDLYQDTLFKAFRSFDSFRGDSLCRAWLKRIMINTYINMYNRKQKITFYSQDDESFDNLPAELPLNHPDPDNLDQDSFLREFVCDEVKRSLMLLPPSHRTVIIMFDMLGLSYSEIARRVRAPMGTVKSRLFRGRVALKQNLINCSPELRGIRN
jgi:RNA polymerase sigma-70 factor (ECF subfamily)